MSNTLDAVKATLTRERTALDKELKQPWYDTFVCGALVCGIAVAIVIMFLDTKKYAIQERMTRMHIEAVTATDKNCNDCHLGASFVNLFNHPMVKADDNVITLMMDKAKIKRW
jgi:hypothetical protein